MPDRLTPLDLSFLYLEEPATVMHVGSVMTFAAPAGGIDIDRVLRHVAARIAFVPRYRQRLRSVPWRLANPVWVDDERFDVNYHVRRSALPRPGTDEQLRELVARVQPRPLDRTRPLWEVYVVEGLAGDRFAVLTKAHQALVDGVNAVDLAQVLLDDDPAAPEPVTDTWRPTPEPSLAELVAGAVMDVVRRPTQVLDAARAGLDDLRATAGKAVGVLGGVLGDALGGMASAARIAARPAPDSPLNVEVCEHRRFAMVATDLADYRAVRDFHARGGRRRRPAAGTRITVNDVALATVAGGLRAWLLTRGAPVTPTTVVRALVPVSVTADEPPDAGGVGTSVASLIVDLPVGEPNPVLRLQQVAYQMTAHVESGRAVGARRIADIGGFAPPTLHSLGARVASGLSRRLFNLVVTNVPGPQHPLYLAGARMLETYPVIPLARGQGLAIGITSYDGGVYLGLNGDREGMRDIDVLAQCLTDALAELRDTVR
ncbi:wax ester/triacylglycerol synthase family O-acyltransferase [Kineosporiaceae bacterium SCSIO 59966]|nr:wax ester/triacylglycerol synthase family O-acyltransferase [Kineosporiaceae bacterium SCSIO 59966]